MIQLKFGDRVIIKTPSMAMMNKISGKPEYYVDALATVIWTKSYPNSETQGISVVIDNPNLCEIGWSYYTGNEFLKKEKIRKFWGLKRRKLNEEKK